VTTTATVNSSPITATVAGASVSATVTSSSTSASASGGVGPAGAAGAAGSAGATGPQGPQGATGPAGTTSWNGLTDRPTTFTPTSHASSHAAAGADPLTLSASQVSGLAAVATSGSAADLSGTLADARLSGNVTRNDNLRWAMQANTNSIDWMPRGHGSFGNAAATSGGLTLVFFTAPYSFTATTLTFCNGGTPTSGLSLCRFGLFTVSETITDSVTATSPVVTLVASTANDTTIGNIANTLYSRTFFADGLPASYALVGGTRYAAGLLVVGTTPGSWMSANLSSGAVMRFPPMVAGFIGSLTDLPTSPQTVPSGTFALYGRIS